MFSQSRAASCAAWEMLDGNLRMRDPKLGINLNLRIQISTIVITNNNKHTFRL